MVDQRLNSLVLRTERATQRLLQCILGSNAWSVDELALEIRNIRIDVDRVLQPGGIDTGAVAEYDVGPIGAPEPSIGAEYVMVQVSFCVFLSLFLLTISCSWLHSISAPIPCCWHHLVGLAPVGLRMLTTASLRAEWLKFIVTDTFSGERRV